MSEKELEFVQEPQISDFGYSHEDEEFVKAYPNSIREYLNFMKYGWVLWLLWISWIVGVGYFLYWDENFVNEVNDWWGILLLVGGFWVCMAISTYIPDSLSVSDAEVAKKINQLINSHTPSSKTLRYLETKKKIEQFHKAVEKFDEYKELYQQKVSRKETPIAHAFAKDIENYLTENIYRQRLNSEEGEAKWKKFLEMVAEYTEFRKNAESDYAHRPDWDSMYWLDNYIKERSRRGINVEYETLEVSNDEINHDDEQKDESEEAEYVESVTDSGVAELSGLTEITPTKPTGTSVDVNPTERTFVGNKNVDFERINQIKMGLGVTGQEAVVEHEKKILREAGREDLAQQVEDVSISQGDGLGYDVLSFTADGTKKFIEVKTTKRGEGSNLYISAHEIAFMKSEPNNSYLYRIVNLNDDTNSGDLMIHQGYDEIMNYFFIEPTQYKLKPRK
jgi:hypothetical protein